MSSFGLYESRNYLNELPIEDFSFFLCPRLDFKVSQAISIKKYKRQ